LTFARCITMWLPRCLTRVNSCRSRIAHTSSPDRTRSLPTGYLNLGHENLFAETFLDFRRGRALEK
jgi:hypothetical protein